jgi:hypothetical protein
MSTESAFHTLCESVIEGHLNLLEALAELKDRGFGTRLEIDSFLCLVKEAAQKRLSQPTGDPARASVCIGRASAQCRQP